MRTALLTIVAALFASTASIAQTKSSQTPMSASTTTDPIMEQRRAISGELKDLLGETQSVLKRATGLAGSTTGPEKEGYTAIAHELKTVKVSLTEQLELVNKGTAEEFGTAITKAREVLVASNATVTALREKLPKDAEKSATDK